MPATKEKFFTESSHEKHDYKEERNWAINIDDLEQKIEVIKDEKKLESLQYFIDKLKQDCIEYVRLKKYRSQVDQTRQEEHFDSETRLSWQQQVSSVDTATRNKHIVIIDDLNIISRRFEELGLDNSWREYLGDDRERIGAWAFSMGIPAQGAEMAEID